MSQTKLSSLLLPSFVRLSNGTRTKEIHVGEKFLIECVSMEIIDGRAVIVCEIGELTLPKSGYDELEGASSYIN